MFHSLTLASATTREQTIAPVSQQQQMDACVSPIIPRAPVPQMTLVPQRTLGSHFHFSFGEIGVVISLFTIIGCSRSRNAPPIRATIPKNASDPRDVLPLIVTGGDMIPQAG